MIQEIYIVVIVLLVAAGGYLIWRLNAELCYEKWLHKTSERQLKLQKIRVSELEKETERLVAKIEGLEKNIKGMSNQMQKDWKDWDEWVDEFELEISTLKSKLQSAYGRIGNLTQQVKRLKSAEPKPVKDEVPPHLFTEFPQEIRQMAWEEMKRLEPEKAQKARNGEAFDINEAFPWKYSKQRFKFWDVWFIWECEGADPDPNHTPPADPNDPIYK